ncbi:MAG: alpha/beta fold hydrolase [Longimicrobiales bacterium]
MTSDDSSAAPHRVGLRRRLPHLPAKVGLPMAPALLLFLSGPRADLNERVEPVEVPDDVVAWVAASEAEVDGIRPGDEKRVVWADPEQPSRTAVSVVYLHGFSADPHEIDPVPQHVATALGANLFATRLTGHGRDGVALGDATAEEWLQDVTEAVAVGRSLGRRVVLMGTSTGATLAVWAAANIGMGEDLAALVLLSPNFHPADRNSRLLLLPWGNVVARTVLGPERCFEPVNPEQERHWTTCYPTRALLPMMALVERVRTLDLAQVTTPTLVIYSEDDQVVAPLDTERAFEKLGADNKRLVPFVGTADPANHVLGGDIVSPSTTDHLVALVLDFVRPLAASIAAEGVQPDDGPAPETAEDTPGESGRS